MGVPSDAIFAGDIILFVSPFPEKQKILTAGYYLLVRSADTERDVLVQERVDLLRKLHTTVAKVEQVRGYLGDFLIFI